MEGTKVPNDSSILIFLNFRLGCSLYFKNTLLGKVWSFGAPLNFNTKLF